MARFILSHKGFPGILRLLTGCCIALAIAAPSSLNAQANDSCAGAISMNFGTLYSVNTAVATSAGDPVPSCRAAFGKGVWYTLTTPTGGAVTISTCESDFDTVLAVYTGSCGAFVPVSGACNDDDGPVCSSSTRASLTFVAAPGTTYRILAGGYNGASGTLRITSAFVPANDGCAGAMALSQASTITLNTLGATTTNEPIPSCQSGFGKGVWFTFSPNVSGTALVNTCGSDFDTVLAVYTGACNSLVPVSDACNDDDGPACAGTRSSLKFAATAGTTYRILAGGYNGASGTLSISAAVLPQNDACTNAIALSEGIPFTLNTAAATTTTNEPTPACDSSFGKGVWFTFTPNVSGSVLLSTCGSDFNTVAAVYSGACDSLAPVAGACNDDNGVDCAGTRASVRFHGVAGTTYRILIGGKAGASGNLSVSVSVCPAPANDLCSGATSIPLATTRTVNTSCASSVGDPTPTCLNTFGNGVWYSFTPSSGGLYRVNTCGSDFNFDTAVQVYSGSCGSLQPVNDGCNDNNFNCGNQADVTFRASAGVTYRILAGGVGGAVGTLRIRIDEVCEPPEFNGSTSFSQEEANGVRVFYQVSFNGTAPASYSWSFSDGFTTNSSSRTISRLFGPFDPLPESFNVTAFNACGSGPGSGSPNPPCGPICLSVGVPTTRTGTDGSGLNSFSLPSSCGPFSSGNTRWFRVSADSSRIGMATVSTDGSSYDTVLAVYRGSISSPDNLVPVACNNDIDAANRQSRIRFETQPETNYWVAVNSTNGGTLKLTYGYESLPPFPGNDTCNSATPMTAGLIYHTNTLNAAGGDSVPTCGTGVGRAVWYAFTPTVTGLVTISTCGSDFDTVLQVYTNSCFSLGALTGGCNDNSGLSCASTNASVSFQGTAGTTYRILVGGNGNAAGNLFIVATVAARPDNDQCPGAIAMGAGDTYLANTVGATTLGDLPPACETNLTRGVWYTFTPSLNGTGMISTCGSDFNTIVAVYTGNCGSLVPVDGACNDDNGPACTGSNASVRFPAVAGTKYTILAGGFANAAGLLRIQASLVPALSNDVCSGAIALVPGAVHMINTAAANAASDPTPDCVVLGRSVWYTFVPSAESLVTVNTCDSDFPTALAVYKGECGSMTALPGGCSTERGTSCENARASLSFNASPSNRYFILAGGIAGAAGNLVIALTESSGSQFNYSFQPTNLPLWDLSGTLEQSSADATRSMTISHSPNGKIVGTQRWETQDASSAMDANGTFKGTVSGSRSNGIVVRALVKGTLSGFSEGEPFSGSFKDSLLLNIDPTNEVLHGTSQMRTCINGSCVTPSRQVVYNMGTNDGGWTLRCRIEPSGAGVRGSALVILPSGRELMFTVTGRYTARTDSFKLRLLGVGEAKGQSLTLTARHEDMQLLKLTGRLFGQKLAR